MRTHLGNQGREHMSDSESSLMSTDDISVTPQRNYISFVFGGSVYALHDLPSLDVKLLKSNAHKLYVFGWRSL